MKLLLDENLPPGLAASLADLFPGSVHVHECGLGESRSRLNCYVLVACEGFEVEAFGLRAQ